uniref:Anoctamin n=1 Tax=Macrostomum lignano TaxID=282301 RepID=A0A1I8GIU1_9PLAT
MRRAPAAGNKGSDDSELRPMMTEGGGDPDSPAPIGFEAIEMAAREEDAAGSGDGAGDQQPQSGVALMKPQQTLTDSLYLQNHFGKDGERLKIDYVLPFPAPPAKDPKNHEAERQRLRDQLVERLNLIGLVVETLLPHESVPQSTGYLLLHSKFDLLTRYASVIKLEMPIADISNEPQEGDEEGGGSVCSDGCFGLKGFFRARENTGEKHDYFTAPFQEERLDMFLYSNDPEKFFTSAQRSLITYNAVVEMPLFSECLSKGAITGYFTLHDGPYKPPSGADTRVQGFDNDRQELYDVWVAPKNWYRFQPLLLVRRYFGEKIAMYFAWLGFYNMWLAPMAVLGLIVFIYGVCTSATNVTADQICEDPEVMEMKLCPGCDKACDYTPLKSSCTYSRIVHVFDNPASILFAILMSLWATCFLEFWKREQAVLQYEWDVNNFQHDEVPRPAYTRQVQSRLRGKADDIENTMDTDSQLRVEMEKGIPIYVRAPRYCLSVSTVLFMIILVLSVVIGVLHSLGIGTSSQARLLTSLSAATINFLCIVVLNQVYRRLAVVLTDLEQPKTEATYEDSFTFKVYCFQFVNYYSSVFYIAFFKGYFHGRPGEYARIGDAFRMEECDPAGCLVELVIQMLIIFVAKQVINCLMEVGVPLLRKLFNKYNLMRGTSAEEKQAEIAKAAEKLGRDLRQCERDWSLLPVDHLQLFDEYLEMVIQFGFVTLFVAAMPLAPLFALMNNVLEVRLDAWKMVALLRRPIARRASSIGIWLQILTAISALAVVTNAVILGFTSEQIPKMVYQHTVGNYSNHNYIKWRLSRFNTSDFEESSRPVNNTEPVCYYRDFRYDEAPYKYRSEFWHVLAARMAFVLVFEHLVLFLKGLIDALVPDYPSKVRDEIKREREVFKSALFNQLKSHANVDVRTKDERDGDGEDGAAVA